MVENVKTFFHKMRRSFLPNRVYYGKLLKTNLTDSIKYFFVLTIFINFLFFLIFYIKAGPTRLYKMRNSIAQAMDQYPAHLKIFAKDGSLMTTYNRPYLMWLDVDRTKTLLFVVDETATLEKIRKYNALLAMSPQGLTINHKLLRSKLSFVPISKINTTIDKASVMRLKGVLTDPYRLAGATLLVVLVVAPLITFVYALAFVAVSSLIAFILFTLVDSRHNHRAAFQLALHAATAPLFALYTVGFLNSQAKNMHIAFFLLILIFTLCALYEAYLDHPAPNRKSPLKARIHTASV